MAAVKIIEIVGNSTEGWEEAAKDALEAATKTLHGITGLEIVKWTAVVSGGEIAEYRATVRVALVVD
jgi:flavin-binding protein dodecin